MDTLEITSLSTKGQIVIPRSIRNQLNLDTGDKLIVVCDGTNILLKPVLMPSMSEFKTLVLFQRLAMTESKIQIFDISLPK